MSTVWCAARLRRTLGMGPRPPHGVAADGAQLAIAASLSSASARRGAGGRDDDASTTRAHERSLTLHSEDAHHAHDMDEIRSRYGLLARHVRLDRHGRHHRKAEA